LFSAGIPYRVYGGLRFFERAEIKHALAYLRLVTNPDDDTSLLRVINFPTRGIGARSLEQLQEVARTNTISLWQAALMQGGKIGAFVALIKEMQEQCNNLPLPEMMDVVTQSSGLRQHYANEKEGEDRIANLDELVSAAVTFVKERDENSLIDFLTFASLEAGEHQADPGRDALQLMTVHAAKGLEFHTVFISGLEEGLCPHEQSMGEANGLEEERRLMYVAVTRARRRLYLSHTQSRMLHGQVRYNVPSRFLDEIPENLLKRLNAKPAPKYPGSSYQSAWQETARPASAAPAPWKIGQAVSHAKFGPGIILAYEGGADARVQVSFKDSGVKWLALEYAKLEAI
jgi:DNA helicase-2/ATP-dependent DNA helicase PcrA